MPKHEKKLDGLRIFSVKIPDSTRQLMERIREVRGGAGQADVARHALKLGLQQIAEKEGLISPGE